MRRCEVRSAKCKVRSAKCEVRRCEGAKCKRQRCGLVLDGDFFVKKTLPLTCVLSPGGGEDNIVNLKGKFVLSCSFLW